MRRVARSTFLKQLTWVCEQAKFHGFAVQVSAERIDITAHDVYRVESKCYGKHHQFIFDRVKEGKR